MADINGLAKELTALESETFEISDFQGGDLLEADSSTTSTSSTCSS